MGVPYRPNIPPEVVCRIKGFDFLIRKWHIPPPPSSKAKPRVPRLNATPRPRTPCSGRSFSTGSPAANKR
eukprot:3164834-Lingulodinium_polyedra.AAC.1